MPSIDVRDYIGLGLVGVISYWITHKVLSYQNYMQGNLCAILEFLCIWEMIADGSTKCKMILDRGLENLNSMICWCCLAFAASSGSWECLDKATHLYCIIWVIDACTFFDKSLFF
jgi:hypothetical protein